MSAALFLANPTPKPTRRNQGIAHNVFQCSNPSKRRRQILSPAGKRGKKVMPGAFFLGSLEVLFLATARRYCCGGFFLCLLSPCHPAATLKTASLLRNASAGSKDCRVALYLVALSLCTHKVSPAKLLLRFLSTGATRHKQPPASTGPGAICAGPAQR